MNATEMASKLKNATVPVGLGSMGSPLNLVKAIWAAWFRGWG